MHDRRLADEERKRLMESQCRVEPSTSDHHVVLFPYMSKGHMIPMLHLARLLLLRRNSPGGGGGNISVTVFTTPRNRSFVVDSLSNTTANVVDIPFPENFPEIPAGVESTDKLPSISLYVPFTRASKMMQPDFERALGLLPPVTFMVSDGFLWWTLESAGKFGFPRLVFFGMNCRSNCLLESAFKNRFLSRVTSDAEAVSVPEFPWIKVTKCDFDPVISDPKPKGPEIELIMDQVKSMNQSHSIIFNSFYELEPVFLDFYKRNSGLRPWSVGPLCLAEQPRTAAVADGEKRFWIEWLDQMLHRGCSVLYAAFGTQAEISREQLEEIALGLEESNVNFLWVMRGKGEEDLGGEGFEERVKDRGLIVRDWVDQPEILAHGSVQGFLSHCGWNSILESICAEVPILAWPMMAEQPLNANMVAEEMKVAARVDDGMTRGFVRREELAKKVKELMEGETGKEARKNVKAYAEMAKKAMEEERGSSWKNLDRLIDELCIEPRN